MILNKSSIFLALTFCVLIGPLLAQRIYFTDGNSIKSINYDGTDEQTFLTNGETPLRLAYDPTISRLFYATYGGEHVWSTDLPMVGNNNLVYDYGAMAGLDAFDAFYSDGIIVAANAIEIDGVSSFPYDGSTLDTWPLKGPPDIGNDLFSGIVVWQANEEVFLSYGTTIYKAGVYDRDAVTIVRTSADPSELDFDQTREYLYFIDGALQNEIWKMDASTGVSTKIYTGASTITRISVNDLNGNLFFLEGNAIEVIPNTGGSSTTIKSGITSPGDIIFIEDPDPYTVKNNNDSGPNSLRYCITNANLSSGQTIQFNIPGTGPYNIQLFSSLPAIIAPMTIDGYTQNGSSTNTTPIDIASDAVIQIELNGASAGVSASGLTIHSSSVTVKGLVINNFSGSGISVGNVNNITIEGNFIGTNVNGTTSVPNSEGIVLDGSSYVTIGGTNRASRNVISGNSQSAIVISNGTSNDQNKILGNFIGVDKTGKTNLGNGHYGIEITNSGTNQIGDNAVVNRNIIGYNQYGILIGGPNAIANHLIGNAIFCNVNGNISLQNNGNNAKSAPVIQYASKDSISGTAQNGDLIEIFKDSSGCTPSGGQALLASVSANSSGFWFYKPSSIKPDNLITATATDPANNTSDFSNYQAVHPQIVGATLDPANRYVDVSFDDNIYNAPNPAISITSGNFKIVFQANGGGATDVSIFSVKKPDSTVEASASDPVGGEKTLRLFLDVSGSQTGTETIEIFPKDDNSLASAANNGVPATSSSGLLTLNPPATAANSQTDYVLCSGETLNVGLVGNLLGTVFNWTSEVTSSLLSGNTLSGSGDIHDLLTNTGSVVDTVTYHVLPSLFGVLGIAYDIKAAVLPEIKATLSLEDDGNSATICSGDTLKLKITVQGVGPWKTEWTNGTITKTETFSSNQHIFTDTPTGNATTYKLNYITSTNSAKQCDGTVSGTVDITIRSIDGDPVISGPSPVCQGKSGVNYTVTDPTPAKTYLWNIPISLSYNGGSVRTSSSGISLNISDTAKTSDIVVTGIYTCYSGERFGKRSAPFTISITQSETTPGNVSGPATVCPGEMNLLYRINSPVAADGYEWNIPAGLATTSGKIRTKATEITLDISNPASSGYLTVRGVFTCDGAEVLGPKSIPLTINIVPLLPKPDVVSGPDAVCQGANNITFSLLPIISGVTKYLWTLPQGASESSGTSAPNIETTTNTISLDFDENNFTGGDITVAVGNQCGVYSENSPPLTVSAKQLPDAPGKITGDSVLCADDNDVRYKINAVRGATSYLWDLPAFMTPTFGSKETKNNELAVKIGNESSKGTITVSAKNECGISEAGPVYIVQISTLPTLNFTLSDREIYIGQVIQLTAEADQDIGGYTWDFGDGKQTEGPETSHIFGKGGSYTVTLTGTNTFNCNGSYSDDLNVIDQLPIIIQNVITQNDDQVNDGLYIQGIDKFPNNEVTLLNRLGSKVIHIEHYANDWDDYFSNKKLEPGNYLCVVKINGIDKTIKQTISVLDNQ